MERFTDEQKLFRLFIFVLNVVTKRLEAELNKTELPEWQKDIMRISVVSGLIDGFIYEINKLRRKKKS